MAKPNKDNSSIRQALLDLKDSGCNLDAITVLIDQIDTDKQKLEDAEHRFNTHQYPEHSLVWCKLQGDIEFGRFLSPNAINILVVMCQNMNHWNLIQLSQRKIKEITAIKSLKYVGPALQELIDTGCITIQIDGTTRIPTVYMVNPEIATVGNPIPNYVNTFWRVADERPVPDVKDYVSPHTRWNSLTAERTYSKGRDFLEVGSKKFSFSKIGEPRLKKSELASEKRKSNPSKKQSTAAPEEQNATETEEQNTAETEEVIKYIPDGPEDETLPFE